MKWNCWFCKTKVKKSERVIIGISFRSKVNVLFARGCDYVFCFDCLEKKTGLEFLSAIEDDQYPSQEAKEKVK